MEIGIPNISISDTRNVEQEVIPPHELVFNILLEDGGNILLEDGGYLLTEMQ